jgi:DNA-binding GntR family transcriptional regulator
VGVSADTAVSAVIFYGTVTPLSARKTSTVKQRVRLPAAARRGGRETLVERAYREIRRRILDNDYPPSHQVLEHELADELQMSRTPVREALVRLKDEGFVQLIPRHGMRVASLSVTDLREMYEVLSALELAAIESLAKTRPDPAQFKPIAAALDDMDRALRKQDLAAWVKADERFHRGLVALCGNSRLMSMVDTLWDQGHRARQMTARLRPSLESSNKEHREVAVAILAGKWREARALHESHRQRTGREIVSLLEQFGLAHR